MNTITPQLTQPEPSQQLQFNFYFDVATPGHPHDGIVDQIVVLSDGNTSNVYVAEGEYDATSGDTIFNPKTMAEGLDLNTTMANIDSDFDGQADGGMLTFTGEENEGYFISSFYVAETQQPSYQLPPGTAAGMVDLNGDGNYEMIVNPMEIFMGNFGDIPADQQTHIKQAVLNYIWKNGGTIPEKSLIVASGEAVK